MIDCMGLIKSFKGWNARKKQKPEYLAKQQKKALKRQALAQKAEQTLQAKIARLRKAYPYDWMTVTPEGELEADGRKAGSRVYKLEEKSRTTKLSDAEKLELFRAKEWNKGWISEYQGGW